VKAKEVRLSVETGAHRCSECGDPVVSLAARNERGEVEWEEPLLCPRCAGRGDYAWAFAVVSSRARSVGELLELARQLLDAAERAAPPARVDGPVCPFLERAERGRFYCSARKTEVELAFEPCLLGARERADRCPDFRRAALLSLAERVAGRAGVGA
jgi:hypothetical protein